jgi:hypothetical protein
MNFEAKEIIVDSDPDIRCILTSTVFANTISKLYDLPSHLITQITESTNTIEERNMAIATTCMMKYLSEKKWPSPNTSTEERVVYLQACFNEVAVDFLVTVAQQFMRECDKQERV